ncbi:hypothetical protein KSP35_17430 [Aquihabitans sp. G128]|uniref:hypothetical protein n=1 Tax=Aquihabitans sp. G128 TaxID=2849779 RepID=UPI001C242817|nr:hypothetical protein [Aquihabitans sp. G128]QXC60124.1 hypothetical protein KSP35_17430 [Aquihabitans sp. G128]
MPDLDGPDVPQPASSLPPDAPGSGQQVEVEVDLGAFLPETSAIGPVEDDEDEGPDPEPDELIAEVAGDAGDAGAGPDEAPAAPPVDLAVLAGIEADLAAVDRAIEAIDAGDHERSPLLVELLGAPPA